MSNENVCSKCNKIPIKKRNKTGFCRSCAAKQRNLKYSHFPNYKGGHIYKTHPWLGRKHSKDTKKKIGETQKERLKRDGHPRLGVKLSEETKRKIGEAHKGKKMSEEAKRKISKAVSGENNPRFKASGNPELSYNYWRAKSRALKEKLMEMQEIPKEKAKEYVVHHVDGNIKNNDINNLMLLTKSDHRKLHNFQQRNNTFKRKKA